MSDGSSGLLAGGSLNGKPAQTIESRPTDDADLDDHKFFWPATFPLT